MKLFDLHFDIISLNNVSNKCDELQRFQRNSAKSMICNIKFGSLNVQGMLNHCTAGVAINLLKDNMLQIH